jgi:AcrR family transcriptional regulator
LATQLQRRTQTRQALLDAAAELFATRGIDGASVDAVAEAAGRTSGAVYDHFGSKEGLLFALLEGWVDDVTAVVGAELAAANTLDEQMAALWRNVSHPVAGDGRWIGLEHEIWRYATRNEDARRRLAGRYRVAWDGINDAWGGDRREVGPAVIGLLLGLEMMRRIDPAAMPDDRAIAALRAVVEAGAPTHAGTAPEPGTAPGTAPHPSTRTGAPAHAGTAPDAPTGARQDQRSGAPEPTPAPAHAGTASEPGARPDETVETTEPHSKEAR